MGESQGLCVSTPVSNPKSVITHAELPMRDNTDSTFLAKTALLLHLLIAYPQKLTSERNMLTQGQGNLRVEHPNPEIYNLTAWRLSTISSKQKAFRKKLGNCFQLHGGQAHKRTTKQNSENLIAGVINGKLIPIRLL